MIELLFNDSTAASLACAKILGDGTCGEGVVITVDEDGNETIEKYTPKPYIGPKIEGSPDDIAAIWLLADIGDISNFPESRINLWHKIAQEYDDDNYDWIEETEEQTNTFIKRLKDASDSGEPIRIWWSDAAGETCGFYWAMDLLKDALGKISSVKMPSIFLSEKGYVNFMSTGDLAPNHLVELLDFERVIDYNERKIYSEEWKSLVSDNSPLRAVINGKICSVPIDFYDYVLDSVINNEEHEVIQIIGQSLINGPNGVSDWWYADRIRKMIEVEKLSIVKENKKFYHSVVKRNN